MNSLQETITALPLSPGVYLMKGAGGEVIYVGKAVALKKRVQSYFSGSRKPAKVRALVQRVHDLEVIVTASELDALILENNLIKKYRPTYNVDLKDDKNYPYVRLDVGHSYPRLEIVRRRRRDGALYFGPYPSAGALRQTLAVLQKHFRLRRCANRQFGNRSRPCLNHQMNLCQAPCCRQVDQQQYRRQVDQAVLFLKGKGPQVVAGLEKEMSALAAGQRFEEAARVRDTILALRQVMMSQKIDSGAGEDLDVIGIAGDEEQGFAVYLLRIRQGNVVGGRPFAFFRFAGYRRELIAAFVQRYYHEDRVPPPTILVPQGADRQELLEQWLSTLRGRGVRLQVPVRGRKAGLLAMASENAQTFFRQQHQTSTDMQQVLAGLGRKVGLQKELEIIECIDISNFQDRFPVASLVTFVNGRPCKDAYRRYRLDHIPGPDDYAMMRAVIDRRFAPSAETAKPDLLLIDGGKGQLSVVSQALDRLGVTMPVVAIAKGRDDLGRKSRSAADSFFLPGRKNPLVLHPHSGAYLLLQQIRDEAHRFAISYHRQCSRKQLTDTALLEIPGIGAVRARRLLETFGSFKGVAAAERDALEACSFLDRSTADRVFQYFRG
ncbi:MAG: excinuclease ABC subunit UvrC [Deltaproteobacteria bacterium]|nr:excinuclease ABC subunit UvrC [Candidatus Anaeroferrophillus wilburensis]MBN2888381.1 excinuclease ABC subunit UvrC [Deltaproteobacteria bacterium]